MSFFWWVSSLVMTETRPTSDAGAGGGRHGDDRRDACGIDPQPVVADILEIPDRPLLAGHQGDGLAGIERAAAAEGDHAVMLAGAQHLEAVLDVLAVGVALDVGEDGDAEAGRPRRRRRRP